MDSKSSEKLREATKRAKERIKSITDAGRQIEVNPCVDPSYYLDSAGDRLSAAEKYFAEGDNLGFLKLSVRFLALFLDKLPRHPTYGSVDERKKRALMPLIHDMTQKAEAAEARLLADYTAVALTELNTYNEGEVKRQIEREHLRLKAMADSLNAADRRGESQHVSWTAQATTAAEAYKRNNYDAEVLNRSTFRTMIVSSLLPAQFLSLAESNTLRDRETCGVLCGKLLDNQYRVTHVVLPKQRGTSNTCDTFEEHEIHAVLEQHGLITLGWIHTHPSQTAFLSSVDLHTHYGYQCLLPEAIAVVCSIRYSQVGYFTLTSSCGMPTLASCRQTGFHRHNSDQSCPLFESAAFVRLSDDYDVRFVDLR